MHLLICETPLEWPWLSQGCFLALVTGCELWSGYEWIWCSKVYPDQVIFITPIIHGTFKAYLISAWLVVYLCLQDSDSNPFNMNRSCFFSHWKQLKKSAVSSSSQSSQILLVCQALQHCLSIFRCLSHFTTGNGFMTTLNSGSWATHWLHL